MGREQQLTFGPAEALGLHHVGNPGMDRHRTIGILVKLSFWKMPVAISMTECRQGKPALHRLPASFTAAASVSSPKRMAVAISEL
ncbi:hypothetical protein X740_17145 [Mesorhizobium sp. LNHC221B00]|nr:hypothetical protein X740_17145 [Mesorhizobium sp. LNHC221B00]